jgi:predicted secreted protein
MNFTSIIAIYFLFFCFSAFVLLPFGVRTTEELGEDKIAGQAESAPHRFDLKRHLLRAAVVAAILFALYYLNYVNGWITANDLDFYNPPATQRSNG